MRWLLFVLLSSARASLATPARAQCTPQWQPGDPLPYASGSTTSLVTWDPDGAGPLPLALVVGSYGMVAGPYGNLRAASFDGTTWTQLGTPANPVTRLTNWNGTLVAVCQGTYTDSLYTWTGSSWTSLAGSDGRVFALTTYNGQLVAGGSFTTIGFANANGIARFDGTNWLPFGSGITGTVRALAPFGGSLYAGGSFTSAGGIAAGNLAFWNGSTWVATPAYNGTVEAMAVRNGLAITQQQLFVAGSFTTIGALVAQHVARFTTSTGLWTALAGGLPGTTVAAMFGVNSGLSSFDLVAAVADPASSQKTWRWNGTAWVALGGVSDTNATASPSCLSYWNGQYVLGLDTADQNVRRYDGTAQWLPVQGAGVQGRIYAIDAGGNDVVIGGSFAQVGATACNGIARGGPGNWQALGSGVDVGGSVFALARTSNGDVVAGGSFPTAGGVAVNHIARWNGTAWSSLGAGFDGPVYAIRVLQNGDLVATGAFTTSGFVACNRIARWNGSAWSPLGSGLSAQGNALAFADNGDLLVGGNFLTAGGVTCNRIARWNGSTWSALGSGFDSAVFAIATLTDGSVFAGGHFQNAGAVPTRYAAIWNGSAWAEPLNIFVRPGADVLSLTPLPDGSVLVGSAFYSLQWGAPPISINVNTCLARWSPGGWQSQEFRGLAAYATGLAPDGTLWAGGDFRFANTTVSGNVAHRVTPCPATANAYGAGCSGSGGPNTLVATALPWLGGTYRGRATGMPPLGFAVVVTGMNPLALPIAAILPQGAPGCSALVSPDVLDLAIPAGGVVTTQLAIPASSSLIGATFRQQVAPFETNALGTVTTITSTQALLMTVGML